ncbi:adenylate/guanylate cyclase domain-containing protein [Aeromicrobium wangtongii]|uniref:Adenylate/guanylate cyclase domain-containing protein n=1 Tax=Aeromicrobium wangtongii TaxID=2969247 RepID=A0ABY5M7L8_9ACTN|nr:adenylate/guanylate cyclase domain-containing protein [Aeromicrobium wangtongii]MCD9198987.1 adenylate/guanylate cyclase domain-containing protein [Aeromicrobium wangtongii]MCL3819908.1 adenylate/guanylate cyclase domain-containing protein [Aeromicrobium wangtongii]UUP12978.1 adenylate/guanylate cyclase domain-containing protein [Aeromicrobium wangtongii]
MNRSELRERLVQLILGGELNLTSAEAADKGGLSVEDGQRLWRALGFADTGDGVAYGDADVDALATVAAALDGDVLDEQTIFQMTRALGTTMSRLADWQVTTLVEQIERDVQAGRAETRLDAAVVLAEEAAPNLEHLMIYAWRRHLAAATARMEALGAADEELLSTVMTVGFADLSRFTSLSNDLDDNSLGALVENFEIRASDIVTAHGGRVIKTLGDAVLFVSDDPAEGTRTALDMVKQIAKRSELPNICVGLATGSVVSRLGDVYGPPVNLAARLSHVARSNRVLVDSATAAAIGDEFDTRTLPPRPLRGFGNISPITVSERRGFRSR